MAHRPLEITVISAQDIKDVNILTKMQVYVAVSLAGGDRRTKQKTPLDKDGGTNPSWNFSLKFNIDEAMSNQNRLILVFKLRSKRTIGDKDIGEVCVPLQELLDNLGDQKSAQFVAYQVKKPSGKPKGVLNFSYKFGNRVTAMLTSAAKATEPVIAYPPPYPLGGGYAASVSPGPYPPPSAPYPPPGYLQEMAGYGYPYPPQQGYGYPPVHKPGMGLAIGLVGGLLIRDLFLSDSNAYDSMYDAEVDDASCFDR